MIEQALHAKINRGFDGQPKAGNGIALSECLPNARETAPSSRKAPNYQCLTCENPLKSARHAGPIRRHCRPQPPATNNNPHSARRTA